jgi:nicotinate-nucleotide adenylyltransferase
MAGMIGVFGGTFDPPHVGHIILAEEARIFLGLEKVLWVPTGAPPHKLDRQISPIEDRLDLVRSAIRGYPEFSLSRADVDRPGPHYSVDTMKWLRERNPGDSFVFLMGSDSLVNLTEWKSPGELLALCDVLGVWHRPDVDLDLPALEGRLPGVTEKTRFIDTAFIRISAREIRRRVREGIPYRHLVPASVNRLIHEKGLFT